MALATFSLVGVINALIVVYRHYNELLNLRMNWQRNLVVVLEAGRLEMRLKKLAEGKTLVKVLQILERSMKKSLVHISKVAQRYACYILLNMVAIFAL